MTFEGSEARSRRKGGNWEGAGEGVRNKNRISLLKKIILPEG